MTKLRLAIVGAGPAGIYAADILLKAERNFDVSIDLFDHLPAPYGLVRYGVAPDHPRIKGIITALREHDVTTQTLAEAHGWARDAVAALVPLPNGSVKKALTRFAETIVERSS